MKKVDDKIDEDDEKIVNIKMMRMIREEIYLKM